MDNEVILKLVKARVGLRTSVRDDYIGMIIEGVKQELNKINNIPVDNTDDTYMLMFIVDFVTWRYENKGEDGGMPRHLHYRLNNLILSNGGEG